MKRRIFSFLMVLVVTISAIPIASIVSFASEGDKSLDRYIEEYGDDEYGYGDDDDVLCDICNKAECECCEICESYPCVCPCDVCGDKPCTCGEVDEYGYGDDEYGYGDDEYGYGDDEYGYGDGGDDVLCDICNKAECECCEICEGYPCVCPCDVCGNKPCTCDEVDEYGYGDDEYGYGDGSDDVLCEICNKAECECCEICDGYPCVCPCDTCGKNPCECPCDTCGKNPCECPEVSTDVSESSSTDPSSSDSTDTSESDSTEPSSETTDEHSCDNKCECAICVCDCVNKECHDCGECDDCIADTCPICGDLGCQIKYGRIRGDDIEVGISDALEILMYLADMPASIINDNERAKSAAMITNPKGEEPVIGDALEILMYLANMPAGILFKIYK